jgi:hypothetical protein
MVLAWMYLKTIEMIGYIKVGMAVDCCWGLRVWEKQTFENEKTRSTRRVLLATGAKRKTCEEKILN